MLIFFSPFMELFIAKSSHRANCEVTFLLRHSTMDSGRCVAKSPKKWHTRDWFCCHNNDPIQPALFVHNVCLKSGMTVVPYLPDLAPCDFILFPKLKLARMRRRSDDSITVELQSQATPTKFKIQDFCKCFQ
jgi:hypothetical protein